VHRPVVGRDHLHGQRRETVHHRADGLLVPGILREGEHHGVALLQRQFRVDPSAMRDMAARGSPWLPVQMSTTLSRGR
jgi:hypothetical protein